MTTSISPKVIIVEPFYGGSHKLLVDTLVSRLSDYSLITLSSKKWHWRARCGALMLYDKIPQINSKGVLFCSSVLNLAELIGIRPDLQQLHKVVYFHENQLVYPIREIKKRDIQYSYNQILTSLAADIILFNSEFNRTSFLNNIKTIIKIFPDYRPKDIKSKIEIKSQVIFFPMNFPQIIPTAKASDILHIVWPHRWEFDKGPDDFFSVLFRIKAEQITFRVSVLGESFTENPQIFATAKDVLKDEIIHFGYVEHKSDYYEILSTAHVVVSTAKHEFFGVSMLESTYCGCYPLVPNSLVYPELYPKDCLYSNCDELYLKLKDLCLNPGSAIESRGKLNIDFDTYSSNCVMNNLLKVVQA